MSLIRACPRSESQRYLWIPRCVRSVLPLFCCYCSKYSRRSHCVWERTKWSLPTAYERILQDSLLHVWISKYDRSLRMFWHLRCFWVTHTYLLSLYAVLPLLPSALKLPMMVAWVSVRAGWVWSTRCRSVVLVLHSISYSSSIKIRRKGTSCFSPAPACFEKKTEPPRLWIWSPNHRVGEIACAMDERDWSRLRSHLMYCLGLALHTKHGLLFPWCEGVLC
jgi:hypothetical protein